MQSQSMVASSATSIIPLGNQLTMSSREIADLTDKLHAHVIRDINSMLEDLLKDDPNLDDELNQSVTYEYDSRNYISNIQLTKKYVECLLTGYSIPLRMRVIERLHQLEQQKHIIIPNFSDPAEAAIAWAEQYKKSQQLEIKQKEDAPKVAYADKAHYDKDGKLISSFAKNIGIGPNKLFAYLRDKGILISSGRRYNTPYQQYTERGYFNVIEKQFEAKGEVRSYYTTLVTGKGRIWLTKILMQDNKITNQGE
ncbi:phage antirepressor KilAC domain-containing protein [Orbus mooreae]|uniref:phage antirepressor KilAC domain-containing protein n=1 Tax=Orbus mooreae TaxID=3074107 RepID=UPI00370D003A